MAQARATKVLITVMTYPHPSRGYQELVCTTGVTDSGDSRFPLPLHRDFP